MSRGHLYIALMAASVLFMAFKETVIYPFIGPYRDTPIQLNVYAWIHLVHLQLLIQVVLTCYDSLPIEEFDNKLYLAAILLDWADFTVTCNQAYFSFSEIAITGNVILLALFIAVFSINKLVCRRN